MIKIENKIKYFNILIKGNLPMTEISILHSAWLSLMDIRQNGDLDILISNKLRNNYFSEFDKNKVFGLPGNYEKRIRIHPINSPYTQFFGGNSNDNLIYFNSLNINGAKFIYPKFYFEYKKFRLNMLLDRKENQNKILRKILFFKKKYYILNKKINKDMVDFLSIENFFKSKKFIEFNKNHNISDSDTIWGKKRSFKDINV